MLSSFSTLFCYFQVDVSKMVVHLVSMNDAGIVISLLMFKHCRGRVAKLVFKGFAEMK